VLKRKILVSGTPGYNDEIIAEGNSYCFVAGEGTRRRCQKVIKVSALANYKSTNFSCPKTARAM